MSRCIPFQEMIAEGHPEKAVVELLREFARDPGYLGAIYNLGLAFDAMGRGELAQGTYRLYLELAPDGYWTSQAKAKLVESSSATREEE